MSMIRRVLFLVLAILALSGALQPVIDMPMGRVWERDEGFLEDSLRSGGGWALGLMTAKGAVAVVRSADAGIVRVGAVLDPVYDLLSDLLEFILASVVVIAAELALIKAIQAFSIKYLLGLGLLGVACAPGRGGAVERAFMALAAISLILYLVYPLSLYALAGAWEHHHAVASMQFSEGMGVMGEQLKDVQGIRGSLDFMQGGLRETSALVWGAFVNLMTGFLVMFGFAPLVSLGAVYMASRLALRLLDQDAGALDGAVERGAGLFMRRTRARLASKDEGPQP